MTPEEKVEALQIALQNSLTSIDAIRHHVDTIMKYSPSYQKLLLIVEHHQKLAEQILRDTQQEKDEVKS